MDVKETATTKFLLQDGRNMTSPSRFPCYYAARKSSFY